MGRARVGLAELAERRAVAWSASSSIWSLKPSQAHARLQELGPLVGAGIRRAGQTNSRTCPSSALKVGPVGAIYAGGAGTRPYDAGVLARLAGDACAFACRRDSAGILARRAGRARLRVVVRVVAGLARGGLDRHAALVL